MTVLAPSSYEEVGVMLPMGAAIRQRAGGHPMAQDRGPHRSTRPGRAWPPGWSRVGTDVCLIGVGKMLAACEEAAGLLEAEGVSATVWDPRSVSPLDPALLDHASDHPWCWWPRTGSPRAASGRLVSSALLAAGGDRSPRVLCAGVPVAYVPHGRAADILADLALDGPGIYARVLGHLGRRWENQAQVSAP